KAVQDWRYLCVVLLAFLLSLMFPSKFSKLRRTTMIVDALGLGAYGIVGSQAALQANLVPLAAILVGVFNATGAGLIRDIMIREEPIIFKPGQYYALAAILACSIFVGLVTLTTADHTFAAIFATSVAFVVRLLSVKYNWQTKAVGGGLK